MYGDCVWYCTELFHPNAKATSWLLVIYTDQWTADSVSEASSILPGSALTLNRATCTENVPDCLLKFTRWQVGRRKMIGRSLRNCPIRTKINEFRSRKRLGEGPWDLLFGNNDCNEISITNRFLIRTATTSFGQ